MPDIPSLLDWINSLPSGVGDILTLIGLSIIVYTTLFLKSNVDHYVETRGAVKIAMYEAKAAKYMDHSATAKLEEAKVRERTVQYELELARIKEQSEM